jgi:hypothetical protein
MRLTPDRSLRIAELQRSVSFNYTEYFENKVLAQRPYLTKEMCIQVVMHPLQKEVQDDGERVRFWAEVPELSGRYLRVVTLADERTIHNAFPDRRFKP